MLAIASQSHFSTHPSTGEGDQIVSSLIRAASPRLPQLCDHWAKFLVEWRLVASGRLSKWSSQPGRLWRTKGVHSLVATIWRCPPDHPLLAIAVLLPVSSDALESPPPTEISMKPDNGKGRWRDVVDAGHPPALTWGVAWRGNVGQIHPRPWNRLECSPAFAGFEPWKRMLEVEHMTSWG